ncbi:hypothetical protein [Halorubrum sp. F4]|uniref:hypothetical protein n=1 Tax=Halorubrum sp. F4 TaxID=2989715 RepID=UPI002480EA9E|nr:hypothetical protein [Halorubrum sp. F4]
MSDEDYSRRRLLGAVAGTGAVGAAGGAVTGAYLADWEPVSEALVRTGSFGLELAVLSRDGLSDPPVPSDDDFGSVATVPVEFPDLSPGSRGTLRVGYRLCEADGWVWVRATGSTESNGPATYLDVRLMGGQVCDRGGTELFVGTLADLLDAFGDGEPLHDDCAGCEPGCLDLEWELDDDVPSRLSGASISCSFEFTAEQCRHNQGRDNPWN